MLSLFCTIIEGARVSTGKVFAERALSTAMDSVLAEYYGPLWEEYHIFGYNLLNDGGAETLDQRIEEKLSEYMSYTFAPDQNQKAFYSEEGTDLYDLSLTNISVTNQARLVDYQGELLINEAIEYMKYRELGDGFELLLRKISLLETPKKISIIYEEKQEVEKELLEIDKGILQLMELLDGLRTDHNGIELSANGKLQVNEYFVKKICLTTVTKASVGINNDNVFSALKNKYINPLSFLQAVRGSAEQLILVNESKNIINNQLIELNANISNQQLQLSSLNSIKKKSPAVKRKISAMKSSIQNLQNQKDSLLSQQEDLDRRKEQLKEAVETTSNDLQEVILPLIPLIRKAITITDNLQYKAGIAEGLVKEYEEALQEQKTELGQEIYAGLEENLKEMKNYITSNEGGYDFSAMSHELTLDEAILNQVQSLLYKGMIEMRQEQYQNLTNTLSDASIELSNYAVSELTLDYSTLVLNQTKEKNPIEEAGNLLNSGITGLIIDKKLLSDKKLSQDQLPSMIAKLSSKNTDYIAMIKSFFENTMAGQNNDAGSDVLYEFNNTSQSLTVLGEGINQIAEILLYQEYLKDHFEYFPTKGEDISSRKPSALSYEQEYLLIGKSSDQENVAAVITRIVLIRMILDFVSILGDKSKCSQAKLVATSLVGFTGLPILISVTSTVILLVWAFMEALLDTCAMLIGKEIPVIKKNIILELPELFLVNRAFLQTKAAKLTETEELSFSYRDYLSLFLLLKNKNELAYQSMDLIQENINLRYEDQFTIQNCIYGFKADAEFHMPSKFINISFVKKTLSKEVSGYQFSVKASYSY